MRPHRARASGSRRRSMPPGTCPGRHEAPAGCDSTETNRHGTFQNWSWSHAQPVLHAVGDPRPVHCEPADRVSDLCPADPVERAVERRERHEQQSHRAAGGVELAAVPVAIAGDLGVVLVQEPRGSDRGPVVRLRDPRHRDLPVADAEHVDRVTLRGRAPRGCRTERRGWAGRSAATRRSDGAWSGSRRRAGRPRPRRPGRAARARSCRRSVATSLRRRVGDRRAELRAPSCRPWRSRARGSSRQRCPRTHSSASSRRRRRPFAKPYEVTAPVTLIDRVPAEIRDGTSSPPRLPRRLPPSAMTARVVQRSELRPHHGADPTTQARGESRPALRSGSRAGEPPLERHGVRDRAPSRRG